MHAGTLAGVRKTRYRQAGGRGGKPQGGWSGSSESLPGSAGDTLGRHDSRRACSFGSGMRIESGKCERGGRKPNGRTGRPRRGEGQESIGCSGCLTVPGIERLLNRSKALESGSTPVRVVLRWSETEPVDVRLSVLCRRSGLGSASRDGVHRFAGGQRD